MAGQQHTGLRRLINACHYSWDGFKACWQHEEAFRQETLLCLLLVPVGLWLGENGVERALLVSSLVLIVIVELLNSGLEAVVDRIGTERHELSKRAKDIGSAAVLLALLNAAFVWLVLLL